MTVDTHYLKDLSVFRDTYGDSDHPNTNYGSTNTVKLSNAPAISDRRSLFAFKMPSGIGTITKLEFILQKESGKNIISVFVFKTSPLNTDWVELEATYNDKKTAVPWSGLTNKIFDAKGILIDTQLMAATVTFDITLINAQWDDLIHLYLETDNPDEEASFYSCDEGVKANTPAIRITYDEDVDVAEITGKLFVDKRAFPQAGAVFNAHIQE